MSADSGGPRPPDPFNLYNVVHRGEMPTPAESANKKFKSPNNVGHAYFTHPSDSEKYFIISGENIRGMDVYDIQEGLIMISKEKFKRIERLQSGDILVQTSSAKQIKALQSTAAFGSDKNPVSISENGVLNQCQGIIRCREIMKVKESRIIEKMSDQNVIAVHRMKRRENGRWIDTATHILTFKSPVCPREVNVGYLTVPTEVFIPSPFRCNVCQKIGHTKKRCNSEKNKPTCGICGSQEVPHSFNLPCFPPFCVNCHGRHPSYSKQCQRYIDEQEINTIRVTMRIPYNLAREELKKRRAYSTNPYNPSKNIPSSIPSVSEAHKSLQNTNMNSDSNQKQTRKSATSVNRSQDLSRVSKVTNKAFKRQITNEKLNTTIQAIFESSNTHTNNAQPTPGGSKDIPPILANIAQNITPTQNPYLNRILKHTQKSVDGHESTTQSPAIPLSPSNLPLPPPSPPPDPDPSPIPPDIEISDVESNSSDVDMNQQIKTNTVSE